MPGRDSPQARSVPSADSIRTLVERAPDVIFRVRMTPRPRLEYINPAVLALTGYSREQWLRDGDLAMRVIHPDDRRKLVAAARSRRALSEPLWLRWVCRDGREATTEIRATFVQGRDGRVVAIEGVAREINAKARASRNPDDGVAAFFERAPAGAAHLALDGRLLHVNHQLCEMTGYSAADLLAKRLHDLTHPDDLSRELTLVQRVMSNEISSYTIEKRVVCRDGAALPVKVSATFARGRSGADGFAIVETAPPPAIREPVQARIDHLGIELDSDRLEVTWSGKNIALTLKEVLLLRYLIRHRGEMLPRDRLLRDVWGYKYSGRSRTLDVHVCRLRRKLPPLSNSLVTIGHFGYTLSNEMPQAGVPARV